MLAKALGAGPKAMLNATFDAGPSPPPVPAGTVGNGTCGATGFGGDCDADPSGAWNAAQEGILSLEACVAKAKPCKMANYVSFSNVPANSDCSWYAACDMGHLCEDCSKCGIGCPTYYPYQSEVLHDVAPPTMPPPPPPPPPPPTPPPIHTTIDWGAKPARVASTAATVEVDVMPFLARTEEGGPFNSYYEALANLGAEFVRFAPWFPYPYVVVTELDPPDCNATHPATNWNSTLSDGVNRDFMAAVCGEGAQAGRCTHSVGAHAATMPVWIYKGAYPVPPGALNPDPFEYYTFDAYNRGSELVNEDCSDMAGRVTMRSSLPRAPGVLPSTTPRVAGTSVVTSSTTLWAATTTRAATGTAAGSRTTGRSSRSSTRTSTAPAGSVTRGVSTPSAPSSRSSPRPSRSRAQRRRAARPGHHHHRSVDPRIC
jgi:hypothetical protein